MDEIVSQITEYCSCQDIDDKDVMEAIDIVSMYAGWTNKSCETFLAEERKEVIELPPCISCVWEFKPYYFPFDADSFTFKFVTQKGLEETVEDVDFVYSEVDDLFRLQLPNNCKCGCECKCECKPTYKLVVTYVAGYETIPDCLLPVFCELVRIIHEKNLCCKDSCGCSSDEETTYSQDDEELTKTLAQTMKDILVEQYKRQLGTISLYRYQPEVWGAVL